VKAQDIDEAEVDRVLGEIKATWKASIARDDRERAESERRLAHAVPPIAKRAWREPTILALCAAACVVALVFARKPVTPRTILVDPASTTASVVEPTPAADPSASASAKPVVVPSAPSSSAAPKSADKTKAEVLPPLPPPSAERERQPAQTKRDSHALRNAHREVSRARHLGEAQGRYLETARKVLRRLASEGEPLVAFEAARELANTYEDEPKEQLRVWDELLRRPLSDAVRARARHERARVEVRLAH
jgi:hypothetical protein